jgi:hypothetical protein
MSEYHYCGIGSFQEECRRLTSRCSRLTLPLFSPHVDGPCCLITGKPSVARSWPHCRLPRRRASENLHCFSTLECKCVEEPLPDPLFRYHRSAAPRCRGSTAGERAPRECTVHGPSPCASGLCQCCSSGTRALCNWAAARNWPMWLCFISIFLLSSNLRKIQKKLQIWFELRKIWNKFPWVDPDLF